MRKIDPHTKEKIRNIFPAAEFDFEGSCDGTWIRTDQWMIEEKELQQLLLLPLVLAGIMVEGGCIVLIVKPCKD